MNQTKFNTTTAQEEWQLLCHIAHFNSVELLILRIYVIFTALSTITSNVASLHKLLTEKQKTRADKMFVILSCSDTGDDLFSLPMMSLELFTCDLEAGAVLPLLWDFLAVFPYTFSSILILIIALDRVLIITKAQVYKKYVTMKVLYWVITLCLPLNFVVVTLYIMEKILQFNSFVIIEIFLSGEFGFIFITIILISLCSIKITETSEQKTWWS